MAKEINLLIYHQVTCYLDNTPKINGHNYFLNIKANNSYYSDKKNTTVLASILH
jgi:hypothetical protein